MLGTIFLEGGGGSFLGTICPRGNYVGDKSCESQFSLGAISGGIFSGGSYLGSNNLGAIIRGTIFFGGSCPRGSYPGSNHPGGNCPGGNYPESNFSRWQLSLNRLREELFNYKHKVKGKAMRKQKLVRSLRFKKGGCLDSLLI